MASNETQTKHNAAAEWHAVKSATAAPRPLSLRRARAISRPLHYTDWKVNVYVILTITSKSRVLGFHGVFQVAFERPPES